MPELPEVETVTRAMRAELEGDTIISVALHREGLRVPFPVDLVVRLEGQRIERVERRAKYILVHLNSGDVFVLHLGMSGRILIRDPKEHAQAEKHDHLVLTTRKNKQVLFRDPRRFGMAFIVSEAELESHSAFRDLGPEPLGNGFSDAVLAEALKNKKIAIKVALLDQHLVAGIGNIYACEALFYAGIDPRLEAGAVKPARLEKLYGTIRMVLEKAIAAGGSSFRDFHSTNGEAGYFQRELAVYDREGKACIGCICDPAKTGGVMRFSQGGRSTFWCPRKQK